MEIPGLVEQSKNDQSSPEECSSSNKPNSNRTLEERERERASCTHLLHAGLCRHRARRLSAACSTACAWRRVRRLPIDQQAAHTQRMCNHCRPTSTLACSHEHTACACQHTATHTHTHVKSSTSKHTQHTNTCTGSCENDEVMKSENPRKFSECFLSNSSPLVY
jgi:hypothetical protein